MTSLQLVHMRMLCSILVTTLSELTGKVGIYETQCDVVQGHIAYTYYTSREAISTLQHLGKKLLKTVQAMTYI
jgi:hypothetical protein